MARSWAMETVSNQVSRAMARSDFRCRALAGGRVDRVSMIGLPREWSALSGACHGRWQARTPVAFDAFGVGAVEGRPVKNLAAMQPPRQAS